MQGNSEKLRFPGWLQASSIFSVGACWWVFRAELEVRLDDPLCYPPSCIERDRARWEGFKWGCLGCRSMCELRSYRLQIANPSCGTLHGRIMLRQEPLQGPVFWRYVVEA